MTEISAMYYASKVLTQQFAGIVHVRYLGHFCTVLMQSGALESIQSMPHSKKTPLAPGMALSLHL